MATCLTADDATLSACMRRAQAGDREAYEIVLDACRDAFTRFAGERCPAGGSHDEVVRRCLLTLHRARHTFDPERSFAAWIEAIARHHGIGPDPARGAWWARLGLALRQLREEAAGHPERTAEP